MACNNSSSTIRRSFKGRPNNHFSNFPFIQQEWVFTLLICNTLPDEAQATNQSYSQCSQRHTLSHIPAVVLQRVTFHCGPGASQERLLFVGPDFKRPQNRASGSGRAARSHGQLARARHCRALARPGAQAPLPVQIALPVAVVGVTTADMKTSPLLLATLLLAGCASQDDVWVPPHDESTPSHTVQSSDPSDGWIHGSLTCVEDGTSYSFRIQKKIAWGGSATGGVVALKEGTRLSGQYTGILPGGRSSAWANASGWNSRGDYASANASAFATWRSTVANAQGTLTDGDGTMIQIAMQIQSGWSPHGIGQGVDNKGRRYTLQF